MLIITIIEGDSVCKNVQSWMLPSMEKSVQSLYQDELTQPPIDKMILSRKLVLIVNLLSATSLFI